MKSIQELLDTLPQTGKVEWIGIRRIRRQAMEVVNEVQTLLDSGLEGDRYAGKSGTRQVTLIQAEHLPVIASCIGLEVVDPGLLRRNLVVSGINLLALKNRHCMIGGVRLEITGQCHPCSRMEELLGAGGYNAVRGHGGVTARVTQNGVIALGDGVQMCLIQS